MHQGGQDPARFHRGPFLVSEAAQVCLFCMFIIPVGSVCAWVPCVERGTFPLETWRRGASCLRVEVQRPP